MLFWDEPQAPRSRITQAEKKRLKGLLYIEQKGRCKHCERKIPADLMELDRKRAGSNGGVYSLTNCQLLCGTCNKSKGSKPDAKAKKQLAPAITGKKPVKKKKKPARSEDSWDFF